MPRISLSSSEKQLQELTDEERRALRASKFAPLGEEQASSSASSQRHSKFGASNPPRMAHPGGPIATNKALALSKFLKRKMESGEADDLNPELVELAVRNAQSTLTSGLKPSKSSHIKHVDKFSDDDSGEEKSGDHGAAPSNNAKTKRKKRKKNKKVDKRKG